MKKLLLCALALTSLAGSMFAADYKVVAFGKKRRILVV